MRDEPMLDLDGHIADVLASGARCVLLTLIHTQGLAARKAGTRALATDTRFLGTLGGGLFEMHARQEAEQALQSGTSSLFSYTGSDDAGRGKRQVLCEVLEARQADLFALVADLRQASPTPDEEPLRGAWLLELTKGTVPTRSLLLNRAPAGETGEARDVVVDPDRLASLLVRTGGKAQILPNEQGPERDLYVEPIALPPVLLFVGADDVAKAAGPLAQSAGFWVDVALAAKNENTDDFPWARHCFHVPDLADLVTQCHIGPGHFVVLAEPSTAKDEEHTAHVLAQLLASAAVYVGLLADSSQSSALFADLKAWGVPAAELAAVHAPAGLNIGADTPEQKAIALVAELLAAKAGLLKQLKSPTCL